jgi:serine protease Do
MNLKTLMLKAAVVVMVFSTVASSPAQPGQIYTFYGEEPWGGSYLGVDTRDVTKDMLPELHLREERGVEVTMVDQDAPAGKSGLKEHDVILSINSQPVESVEQLRRLIREIPVGRTITIGISRDGQPMTLTAQLADRNKFAKMDEKDFHFNMPAIHIPQINIPEMDMAGPVVVMHSPSRSGLMVENLTPQLGDFFGAKNGTGVLVRSVERGSRAEQAGFKAGDVVIKVNGSTVNDSGDFLRLLRSRSSSKASVTVLRDRKEQTLTLTMPEPRHSGEVIEEESEDLGPEIEAQVRAAADLAAQAETMRTAELKRIEPELKCQRKQLQKQSEELQEQQKELQEQMQDMQRDFQDQQQEMQFELQRFTRDTTI